MKFGNLNYRRGVITYSLSPYEQNAYAGFFSHGFPSLMRRFREKVLVVGTPFVLCYLIVEWANAENKRSKRKAAHANQ
ncbi:Cytochrome b-c1 complex subunit 8 [Schistosoma japonicum]|uniref:Cytochrome b-c1 complex subunit 8 n=2 Tax=Schistosoma japonicum TaxID=6182 RepID=C1L8W8_SCHJA|nr:Cytochrome b-c1 complex subunit 8 [Schistosoma japonicum]KAH8871656.1 Cytochrome b-c1 complex subunit 8 [Schistosoma japonicum]TNN08262.1 Cytochrome b-c1 complex subunit 8 [Schistosoma japonicum]CAX71146.1 ubiquinol-cytochrome c reductase, complex III subunit VII [Schistosoma japonicum]CAX76555.1 ubiquinol-cytochrome c reductase, complex III subunit VII [Schistosoma japonicum]